MISAKEARKIIANTFFDTKEFTDITEELNNRIIDNSKKGMNMYSCRANTLGKYLICIINLLKEKGYIVSDLHLSDGEYITINW